MCGRDLQEASRRNRKRKAMGGIVMGRRINLIEEEMKIETDREGLMRRRVK